MSSTANVLLKILLILTMGKSALLAKQSESGDDMMVITRRPNCLEQSVNSTRKGGHHMREGIGVLREHLDTENDVNDKVKEDDVNHKEDMEEEEDTFQLVNKCLSGRQPSANLTREIQEKAGRIGVMREGLVAMDMDNIKGDTEEEEENTFQLVDKTAKALLQPRELCRHK